MLQKLPSILAHKSRQDLNIYMYNDHATHLTVNRISTLMCKDQLCAADNRRDCIYIYIYIYVCVCMCFVYTVNSQAAHQTVGGIVQVAVDIGGNNDIQ